MSGIVNSNSSTKAGARSPKSSLSVIRSRQNKRRLYTRAVFGSKDRRFPKRDPEIEAIYPGHLLPSSPQMLEVLRRSLELELFGCDARRLIMLRAACMNDWSYEETNNPLLADRRNFYKVEQWSKDDQRIVRFLHASNSIDRARKIFNAAAKRRPRGGYTIRQGIRVLNRWPPSSSGDHII
jgi:hypothetical protein